LTAKSRTVFARQCESASPAITTVSASFAASINLRFGSVDGSDSSGTSAWTAL